MCCVMVEVKFGSLRDDGTTLSEARCFTAETRTSNHHAFDICVAVRVVGSLSVCSAVCSSRLYNPACSLTTK